MNFNDEIQSCPTSGSGVHSWIMRCANLAAKDGVQWNEAHDAITGRMTRKQEPRNEVSSALTKAYKEAGCKFRPNPCKDVPVREKIFHALTRECMDFRQVAERSPVDVGSPYDLECQRANCLKLLRRLYWHGETVFLGERFQTKEGMRTVLAWCDYIEDGGHIPSQWVPNPFIGEAVDNDGKLSYRCDKAIARRPFVVCESDRYPLDMQAGYWMTQTAFPLVALIYSGGKSLHAIIESRVKSEKEWEEKIEQSLFPHVLVPLGFDPQCRNESRLSRSPGHFRVDKGQLQSLLWLRGAE